MKEAILKGHPLTEDVMKEVKGGTILEGSKKNKMNFCPDCGYRYTDEDKENDDIFEERDGVWRATCPNCGSKNVVE